MTNPDVETGEIIGMICRSCYAVIYKGRSVRKQFPILKNPERQDPAKKLVRYYCEQCNIYMGWNIAKEHKAMFIAHKLVRLLLPKEQVAQLEEKRKLPQYRLQWNPIPALA